MYLGLYDAEEAAARSYDVALLTTRGAPGAAAATNFPPKDCAQFCGDARCGLILCRLTV